MVLTVRRSGSLIIRFTRDLLGLHGVIIFATRSRRRCTSHVQVPSGTKGHFLHGKWVIARLATPMQVDGAWYPYFFNGSFYGSICTTCYQCCPGIITCASVSILPRGNKGAGEKGHFGFHYFKYMYMIRYATRKNFRIITIRLFSSLSVTNYGTSKGAMLSSLFSFFCFFSNVFISIQGEGFGVIFLISCGVLR